VKGATLLPKIARGAIQGYAVDVGDDGGTAP